MSQTVGAILELLNAIAPLELAEEWDNVGLLAGRMDAPVDAVLCALDLNRRVLDEAVEQGAQLIVTHHPILFRGRKNLREDDAEGRLLCALVRSGVAMIAMHTNYDNARPGVNDALAAALNLRDVEALENGMRLGTVGETDFGLFATEAELILGGPIRCYGDFGRRIRVPRLERFGMDNARRRPRARGGDHRRLRENQPVLRASWGYALASSR